ncbi:MAG: heme exporter protein CcmD [Pseudomonadota bacterium]
MDATFFVPLAYGATAALLGLLCLATWARARAVRAQTKATDPS